MEHLGAAATLPNRPAIRIINLRKWNDLWTHRGAGSPSVRANKRIRSLTGIVNIYDVLSWLCLQLVGDVFLFLSPSLQRCCGLLSTVADLERCCLFYSAASRAEFSMDAVNLFALGFPALCSVRTTKSTLSMLTQSCSTSWDSNVRKQHSN